MDPAIFDITRTDTRYAYEAYEFLCDAVGYTQDMLGRVPMEEDDPDADYHVDGEELARGVCELAIDEFGMMAPIVFKQWGIQETDDIGNIVFNLIEAEKLSQSDRDSPEDFHDLFDIEAYLMDGFLLTADDATSSEADQ